MIAEHHNLQAPSSTEPRTSVRTTIEAVRQVRSVQGTDKLSIRGNRSGKDGTSEVVSDYHFHPERPGERPGQRNAMSTQ